MGKTGKIDQTLEKLYYDLKQGYSNADKLYTQARQKLPTIKRSDIEKWLSSQSAYTLHKPARRKYSRNRILVTYIDELWQLDLADVSNIRKYNDGFRYILTCIDCFSKYAWAVTLKTKSSVSVTDAMRNILKCGRVPWKIQTDRGKEFLNKDFLNLLKRKYIHFYTTNNNETKCSIVERFNRTLKEKMYKYFTHKNTYKYIDILDDFLHNYNNSVHRTIGFAPGKVNAQNENEILQKVFRLNSDDTATFKYQIGDTVRVNKLKRLFDKGYLANWSEEIFKICKRLARNPPVYVIKDYNNEEIEGTFYEKELQKVDNPNTNYIVEKIIKTRTRNKKKEYWVK